MKQTLRALFLNYGEVLDVVAHRNLRMRGQAFVSFPNAEIAKKAQREVNRFPLYSKPMVSLRLFFYYLLFVRTYNVCSKFLLPRSAQMPWS